MKFVSMEKLNKLYEANQATRGTEEYMKYWMETWSKCGRVYKFIGWGIPYDTNTDKDAIVKQFKGKSFLYMPSGDRYTLTEEVESFLNI